MPLDPMPVDFMFCRERVEFAPQVGVLDRLLVGGLPAVALPAVDPRLDAVLDVLRIGVDRYPTAAFEAGERLNDRGHFHPIVGRVRLASKQFALSAVALEQGAPAARARIAFAGAIGVDDNRRRHATALNRRVRRTRAPAAPPMRVPSCARVSST